MKFKEGRRMKGFLSRFFILALGALVLFVVAACVEKVESVTVIGDDVVEMGDTPIYTVVVTPSDMQSMTVTWSIVAGTGNATITQTGELTPVAAGTVTIVATVGGVEGTLVVTIIQPTTGVSVTGPDSVWLGENETFGFTVLPAGAVYDTAVFAVLAGTGSATITQAGVLTPVTAGTITVRVTIDGAVIGTKLVTILIPLDTFAIQGPSEVRMEEAPTYTYLITPVNADVDTFEWDVEDGTGSATIDQGGVLTPVSPGLVTIILDINGVIEEREIEIIRSVISVEVEGETVILPEDRPTYEAIVLPVDAKYPTVTWSVINGTGSATITQAGVLTPVASGTIIVVATADGVSGELEVEIEEDDRLLGTPRPAHVLATPENTLFIDGEWESIDDHEGLDVVFARQVYDVTFTAAASISAQGVQFAIPNDVDISRMQYFAIKVTGLTVTPGVNPTVSVHLKDFASGLLLYNDQHTEIEVTSANQWIIFQVSNRYRLQTLDRDLRILLDPHFTASGNAGTLTIQRVVFFGNADPITEPQLLTPLKNAHWEAVPVFTAEAAVDMIDEEPVDVILASATAEAVSGWRSLPAYVLEDISRKTHITFKVKLLTAGLPSNPRLMVTLGDTDVQNVTISRTNLTTYQTFTVTIPSGLRTENNMWAARYIQLKPNAGGNLAVQYYIYDFKLTGDANPQPIIATRTELGGPNVPLTAVNYVENGTWSNVPANGDPAHILFTPANDATLSKLEFAPVTTSANLAARQGMNGVYVRIQGPEGTEINIQRNWGDGWADEAQRKFALDGTVQEFYILALNRSDITTGTSWVGFQFNASHPTGFSDAQIKIFEFGYTAIMPQAEAIHPYDIHFGRFIEGGNTIVIDGEDEIDTMIVTYDEDGHAVATVELDHANNHLVAIAANDSLRYMNQLTIRMQGVAGTLVTIKLAYGNMFNMDVDYVHEFTTNDIEEIVITILDRDALKVNKISLSLFIDMNEVETDNEFVIHEAFFSGVIDD
ncbi:MAG: hypothetical protein EA375_06140 [Acholeplasmataceae bacterium]|nr:MAG: hypothetical protein EA375_06140 [Acholeplasmataceae bacterium]